MPTRQTIHFMADGHRLTGTLHLPDIPEPPLVIGCHGLLADRRSPKQIALAEALGAQLRLAYLRFDHRGCGDSQGALTAAGLLQARCSDLYHAMQTMQTHPAVGPLVGLFGSSFGGTVVMAVAAEHPVPCAITYAAPVTSRSIEEAAARQMNTGLQTLEALTFDLGPMLPALRNILVVHGENDEIVPLSHARRIYEQAAEPKQLIIQPAGDHRMSAPHHQDQFLQDCIAWFKDRL